MTSQSVENQRNSRRCWKTPATILVVDDEPLTCWSIAEVLVERGFHVRKAGDASSALQAIASADPVRSCASRHAPARLGRPHRPVGIHPAFPSAGRAHDRARKPALSADARRRGAVAVMNKPFEIHALAPMVEEIPQERGPETIERERPLY